MTMDDETTQTLPLQDAAIAAAHELSERQRQQAESDYKNRRDRAEAEIRSKMMRCLGVEPEMVRHDGEVTIGQVDGLCFRYWFRHGVYSLTRIAECERCGHHMYSWGIDCLSDLGRTLLPDYKFTHECPKDAEDWLINREIREAEIAKEAAKRAAEQPSAWKSICYLVEELGIEAHAANVLAGVIGIAQALGGDEEVQL